MEHWGPYLCLVLPRYRAGPPYDFLIFARVRHDVLHCDLYSRDSLLGPVGANFGPRRVTCRVNRRLLSPTHTIRYMVRTFSLVTDPHRHEVSDWAPDRYVWYPRV